MRLSVFAAALVLGGAAALPAEAQTYGQPTYFTARGVGETSVRAYAATGAYATGHGPAPRPYVPAPWADGRAGYGYGHGPDRGGRYGYSASRSAPRYGYRDDWGYRDDRPPSRFRSARSWRGPARDDCRCDPPYLYDR